ncbi:glycoside hydrolase family protein [Citrobacter sp. OP27]
MRSKIIPLLRFEEGVRHTPYRDSLGYPTTGVGFRLAAAGQPLPSFQIGDATINAWLGELVGDTHDDMSCVDDIVDAMCECNQQRRDILTSMAYQMGVAGLEEFQHMLQAIIKRNWDEAANQMLDSQWAKQTPERAKRHAEVMRTGRWIPTYSGAL